MTQTANVITPISQENSYEIGRTMGRLARTWAHYDPPPNSDAAFLVGYDAGYAYQDEIYALRLTDDLAEDQPATDNEARFELDMEWFDAMGKW